MVRPAADARTGDAGRRPGAGGAARGARAHRRDLQREARGRARDEKRPPSAARDEPGASTRGNPGNPPPGRGVRLTKAAEVIGGRDDILADINGFVG